VIEPVAQTLLQAHVPQDVGLIDVVNPACCAGWGAQALCATGSIMQIWSLNRRICSHFCMIEPVAQTFIQAHVPQDVGLIDVVNPACCAGWGAQALCATGSITISARLQGTGIRVNT